MRNHRRHLAASLAAAAFLIASPAGAFAQGREKADTAPAKTGGIEKVDTAPQKSEPIFTPEIQVKIRDYYANHDVRGVRSLPPGIQRRLARGKPLPPGIAMRAAPADLRSRVQVPKGYELVEVGRDVLLVETATKVVHDLLKGVVR